VDAAQALAELTEISSEIETAAIADQQGNVTATTHQSGDALAAAGRALLEQAARVQGREPAQRAVKAVNDALAARKAQLDVLGLGDVGEGPVGPERRVLPYRSSGAASPVAALAGGAFWDASAREVAGAMSRVGVRTCAECELSLSATARFCRRCGHPQSQSA